jgi:chromosome segregation ATPase
MKNVSESLLQLEDDRDASLRKIQNLEAELGDANEELNRQDKLLSEERSKNERLDVQLESCQGEIDFLREEQEGDKIKIGELESALNHTQVTLQEARERSRDLEERMAEERQQRDVLETQEKQEVEKIITDLNGQLTKLKEDSRKLRKNLSSKEVEASTWKQRHDELEHTLRESLGNLNGTRSSLFKVSETDYSGWTYTNPKFPGHCKAPTRPPSDYARARSCQSRSCRKGPFVACPRHPPGERRFGKPPSFRDART